MDAPSTPIILGIAGNTKSGKDTLARFLAEEYRCTITHFADTFKNILKDVFDFSDDQLWGNSKNIPDQRYPFSGICPLDHAKCTFSNGEKFWHCPVCNNTYQQFLTPRFTMLTLGTEWGRAMYANVWIDMTLRHIQKAFQTENKDRWIIADMRFQKEVDAIRKLGGTTVLIKRGVPSEHLWHATEAELLTIPDAMFDSVIDNNGTLDDLKTKAHELGKRLFLDA